MADPGYNLSGRIPVDGTLVALLLPSIAISAIAIPGGFITFTLRRNTEGVASELVNSGATSNYYWLLLQYVPVIVTLTFATSMVYSGRVVAIAWGVDTDKEDMRKMKELQRKGQEMEEGKKAGGEVSEVEPLNATNAPDESSGGSKNHTKEDLRKAFDAIDTNKSNDIDKKELLEVMRKLGEEPNDKDIDIMMKEATKGTSKKKLDFDAFVNSAGKWRELRDKVVNMTKQDIAQKNVKRMSTFEMGQWALLIIFIVEIVGIGFIADNSKPLWNGMLLYLIGFVVLGLFLMIFAMFTLRNLRTTMVKREGKKTVEYVAEFLGRIRITLIIQHLCFFAVAIASCNMTPAFQPVAFSLISVRANAEPCSLLTSKYLNNNCTRALDLYRYGPVGAGHYECGHKYRWEGYSSAYAACGGVTAAIQLRNMGYSAVMISFNAFLYVLLKECTRDMGKMAMSKMTRGKSDARSSIIFALTGMALACNPLFFVFMLLSPLMLFKVDLSSVLTLAFFFNMVCWVLVGLLLNLEFFVAKIRSDVEYDVMISYRVHSEAELAQDLYRKLKQEGVRVYLDKFCLEDGKSFEEGFMNGLSKSSVYVLLFSLNGMRQFEKLKQEQLEPDNVLLEMRMARELQTRRREQFRVFPLLLGEYNRNGKFEEFSFAAKGQVAWPTEGIDVVEKKVDEKLKEITAGLKALTSPGVKDNVDWFFKIQGLPSTNIDYAQYLDVASRRIAAVADEVKTHSDTGGSLFEALKSIMPQKKGRSFQKGENVWVHSAKFKDGTQLRDDPNEKDKFNNQHVLNGDKVEVLEVKTFNGKYPYAKIRKVCDTNEDQPAEGWILQQNLTHQKGVRGTTGMLSGKAAKVSPAPETVPADSMGDK